VSSQFAGLPRRQPHLLCSAIQGHDELPQKVHAQQTFHRGSVREQLRDSHWEALHHRLPYSKGTSCTTGTSCRWPSATVMLRLGVLAVISIPNRWATHGVMRVCEAPVSSRSNTDSV
jgi:hypothetical protein